MREWNVSFPFTTSLRDAVAWWRRKKTNSPTIDCIQSKSYLINVLFQLFPGAVIAHAVHQGDDNEYSRQILDISLQSKLELKTSRNEWHKETNFDYTVSE